MSSTIHTSTGRSHAGGHKFDSLIRLLETRAAEQPERLAYTFLRDGEVEEVNLSCGELARRARAVGAWLQERGLQGERALLLYPPGLEYIAAFWGCLYAGVVAVPAYPPRLNRHLGRLRAMAADAQARVALTTSSVLARLEPLLGEDSALRSLAWTATDEIEAGMAERWREPRVDRATLAFLQYTSGSTATPKGVMVSHGNLLHNEELIRRAFRQSERSVIVGWLPLYHDMGLIGNVLQPLYLGARCILMSPTAFLQQPSRWLRAISRYRATTSGGPNFAYDLCARKVSAEERATLDLSSWSVAFNGAEPVRPETLERFAAAFGPCGFRRDAFYPCYGLAEATLFVAGALEARPPLVKPVRRVALEKGITAAPSSPADDSVALVGCGSSPRGQQIVVVNPETLKRRAGGEVGEVWVGGPSVAGGYWNRPEETAQTFGAYLADTGDGPFLRTGDLGFLDRGELFITGRIKDLIIIRGRNLYPHEIERTVEESHDALKPGCGAAFAIEDGDGERLVIVQEVVRRAASSPDEMIASIRQAVAEEHEIQPHHIALVGAGGVPKTSSGKVQRGACRELFLLSRLDTLAAWQSGGDADAGDADGAAAELAEGDEVEELASRLRAQVAAKLGVGAATIDVSQPLTRYGLDSLAAVELGHAIESEFGVEWPMASLLEGLSLLELAGRLRARLGEAAGTPTPDATPAGAAHALSHGQQALWFLHRMAPDSAAYNVAAAARVRGPLDAAALKDAFAALAARHAALRTAFEVADGTPAQRVHGHLPLSFEEVDASSWSQAVTDERLGEEALRPFDLGAGPLWRVTLLKLPGDERLLLIVAHHIIVDFWSLAVMWREVGELYRARPHAERANLPPLRAQYADHVRRQSELLQGPEGERQWGYWERQLGGTLPALDLPCDRPRPPVQTYRGAAHAFRLDGSLTRRLKELALDSGATLYATLLAAFDALLHRYTGQEDFAVGSPSSGRDSAALTRSVGYFVNPLVMRADLSGDPSFVELLARVRRTALDAFAHQDYPFALLVQRLQPERDASRTPLFQVMFTFQPSRLLEGEGLSAFAVGEGGASVEAGDLVLESLSLPQRVALFDLRLSMTEADGALLASLEYNTDLFDAETVARMAGHFETLLESVAADPLRRVSELSLLSPAERRRLTVEWNDTAVSYPAARSLHELFEAQAARTPDATALVYEGEELTYSELNRRANKVARRLRGLGVGPDALVGVCMERSTELVAGLLGVLKAGGAYLPLDPSYPPQRLQFMFADARPPVLLTQQRLLPSLPAHGAQVVCLDAPEWRATEAHDAENPSVEVSGLNLAYVIYTSGSTGRPKGAMNTHRAIRNRLLWMQDAYRLDASDRVLQKTPYSFDVSVWEFFWPLMTGARLVVAKPGGHQDAAYLAELIKRERITTVHFVPSMLQVFLAGGGAQRCASLRRVICSGEALSHELQERFFARLGAELHNLYGPTEAAVDVTAWACERGGQRRGVPIGRPIANTQIYILDRDARPVPVGVAGELHIGGVSLARGYLNRAELTAERFAPDPFAGEPGARLYKTGDLARFLPGGEIEYLGRLDHQVKVRGQRIELGEIEAVLCEHAAVREAVVVREDAPGDVRLVAYVVGRGETPLAGAELRRHLRERLPDYMIPAAFVTLDELPLSPNGKVERRALPAPSSLRPEAEGEFVAPRDQIEEVLAGIWAAVLGVEQVGINDNFFDLGGHSLLAAQVIARVNEAFRVELPLRDLFESPTVAALGAHVTATLREGGAGQLAQPIERVARDGPLPLSFAQQRLWFLDQLEPGSAAYNIPVAVRLAGPLDVPALERSVREIIHRHEALRTTFKNVNERPVQVITPPGPWRLDVIDLGAVEEAEREAEALRRVREEAQHPFDLAQGPLLRAALWRLSDDDHVLLVAMHHIVADGWSIGVFVRELSALYNAFAEGRPSPLAELPVQYTDFAQWQRQRLSGDSLAEHLRYWKRHLAGPLPVLELPSDRARLPSRSFRVVTEPVAFPDALCDALRDFRRQRGATPFMALLATFQTLLHRYTGLDDIVVGTPVAGRTHLETESLIGFFANTLVLRGDLSGDPSFAELLGRARELTLEAHAHQDLPFEKLVEELQPERDLDRTPLFQVMLVMQNTPPPGMNLRGLGVRRLELEGATAKFDLILFITESEGRLAGYWEYNADRFDSGTVKRMAAHFQTLLASALADPDERVSKLAMLPAAERHRVVNEWNDTAADYPRGLCIHELVAAQAARSPHAVALIHDEERLTYAELNGRANRLAHHLRALGVGPEALVGILLDRTPEMVVALLGVLKAGGAYVPLDPGYPRERIQFMLEDARPLALLTHERLKGLLPQHAARVVCLDTEREEIGRRPGDDPPKPADDSDLAYVIYTSGSTGRPKGVAIEHRSVAVFIHWAREIFSAEQLAGVLASTSICFDLSIFEIFVPLSWGGKVILAANALELPSIPAAREVTLINTVPSAMTELVRMDAVPDSALAVNLAGEPLQNSLAQRAYGRAGVAQVLNLYGPSEDTTYSTWSLVEKGGSQQPTIGRPVACTQAYILDKQLQPAPIGVAGELYLGGSGLARGYLKRPELTAERFVPDPFSAAPGGRLYRTGDLARYLSSGHIEYLGRLDHQVKIRGFRIEPGEIEAALGEHAAVSEAVVVPRETASGDKQLVAYVAPAEGRACAVEELRAHLRERLPKYMIPASFVLLGELPLTPNGKLDRRALPAPEGSSAAAPAARVEPRTQVEQVLAQIWAQLLNRRHVGVNENFFELGGHSLLATQVVSRVREMFRVEIPLRSIFGAVTIEGLAERIENSLRAARMIAPPPDSPSGAEGGGPAGEDAPGGAAAEVADASATAPASPILPAPRDGALPLSFAQQRLWFLDQLVPGNPAYNIQAAVRLSGQLDVDALARTLNEVVRRHEILRTTFHAVEGRPAQVVGPAEELRLEVRDGSGLDAAAQEQSVGRLAAEESRRPFDLTRGPLLRFSLLRLGEAEHVLLLTMHHIVSDGWSMGVLVREVAALYEAFSAARPSPLAELPIQYADFAVWQRQALTGETLQSQLDYWRAQLGAAPAALELPTDHPRPPEQSYRGARRFFALSPELSDGLRALSQREGVTLYMTLLAALQTLLHRYTGQTEIVVGTDIANRRRREIEGLIGFFTNQLVLRADFSGNPTFGELLRRVREVALGAYAHQDLPFEKLVEALQPERTLDRNPLFQVMFVFQNAPMQPLELPGLSLRALEIDEGTTAFDLSLTMMETDEGITGSMRYSVDLFEAATIERMLKHFENILRGVVASTETPVEALELQSDAERRQSEAAKKRRTESKLRRLASVKPRAAAISEESLFKTSHLPGCGRLPLVIQPASAELDLAAWAARRRDTIEAGLAEHGAILFRDFAVGSLDVFEKFTRALSHELLEYGERSSPRTRLGRGVYTSTDHPPDQHILLHNEQSYTLNWPMRIWFFCQQPALSGGSTPIADSREIYRRLDPALVREFEEKSVMYVRNYGDGLGLPWQEVFQTTERAEVEAHCRRAAIEFEWKDGDRLRTRQVRPAVRVHPRTGEPVWFNHALFFHVSSLDAPTRAALASLDEDELPFNTFYGDATPIPPAVMAEIHEAYRQATVSFPWQAGDILMLDNMLTAHGREPFGGPRRVVVAMADPFLGAHGGAVEREAV